MWRITLLSIIIFYLIPFAQANDDLGEVNGIIEKIEIRGSSKIREKFIRREITIKVGDEFDVHKAIESKNKIMLNLKYIEQTNLYIEPGSEKGKLVVIFEIEERKSKFLTLGAGYNDDERFSGYFQVWYENFLHRGLLLGVEFKKGKNVDCQSLILYEPRILHSPYSFKFKIYTDEHKRTEFPYEDKGKYWLHKDGWMLELGKRNIFKNANLWLNYQNKNVNLTDLQDVSQEINLTQKKAKINSLICYLNFDTCKFQQLTGKHKLTFEDYEITWPNPISGGRYEVIVEVVDDFFHANYNFNKYNLNLNQYLNLSYEQVLTLMAKGGYIAGNAPFYERFYVGSIDTVRGYKQRGLTSTPGNKLLVLTTEYRLGLTDFLQGILFVDAGYSWEKSKKINLGDLEYGIGTGLRIYHPLIGRINFNLGYGLDKKDWEIHLGVANRGE